MITARVTLPAAAELPAHISLVCRLKRGTPHDPCSGTCDAHELDGLPCQCECHGLSRDLAALLLDMRDALICFIEGQGMGSVTDTGYRPAVATADAAFYADGHRYEMTLKRCPPPS